MRIFTGQWGDRTGWIFDGGDLAGAQAVIYFASPNIMSNRHCLDDLRARFPAARIIGCTTGGEILGSEVYDGTAVATALRFDRASVDLRTASLEEEGGSFEVGQRLALDLPKPGLRGVFVLSDGTRINGSELLRGLKQMLPEGTVLTGGLAGDGASFHSTLVVGDGEPRSGLVVALGFYGAALDIRHGSFGGWEPFGPERIITRSEHNVLYEIDGQPALDLYRRYLGDQADQLPGSALLFPLRVQGLEPGASDLVRTVVGIDEVHRAMIFAGDVPEGHRAQLMHGNFDELIDAASVAARQARCDGAALAILVSCIGRKLLLGQRVAEEVEAAVGVLGGDCVPIGFYSYGEISPHDFSGSCELHNQTMTITVLREIHAQAS